MNTTLPGTVVSDGFHPRGGPGGSAHYLVVVEGREPGRRMEIGDDPVTLGRDLACPFQLHDAEISKQHCRVALFHGTVGVEDLGSTNGTYVDGTRISGSALLPVESVLQIGKHVLKHEFRSRVEVEATAELTADLLRARRYVEALIPAPLADGPIRTDWCFVPSAQLGGDAFGYHDLDDDKLCVFLLDVCGHGARAAMHSVSVVNVIRSRTLPDTDLTDPAAVLDALNRAFRMIDHDGIFFTIWYGVYHRSTRELVHASAGHPPAVVISPDGKRVRLDSKNPPIGTLDELNARSDRAAMPAGARLYLFSDGVYEITTTAGEAWGVGDFIDLLGGTDEAGSPEATRLHSAVCVAAGRDRLDDDFSLLITTFD